MIRARRSQGKPATIPAVLAGPLFTVSAAMRFLATIGVLLAIGVADAREPAQVPAAPPPTLAETGLYADAATKRVDARNLPFSPQYPLWSDGADKRRWIFIPPGKAIDASDPDSWKFPVGTKLWKEFSWDGRRVETRFLYRSRGGWHYAAYVWDRDGATAALAPARGVTSEQAVAPGKRHVIPGVADCRNCHQGGRSEVLGFGTLQLSPDRDPLAPHAERVPDGGVTLAELAKRGLVRGLPRRHLDTPPRIPASTPRGRAALGYLHANCGGCHDTKGPVASIGLALRHLLSVHELSAHRPAVAPVPTAIGQGSPIAAAGVAPSESSWIARGEPSRSTVVTRMASRAPATQMPPLGTLVVDEEAVALITAWIREDLAVTNDPAQPHDR